MEQYEWGIVGGGIAGITIAEILTRQGHKCILIEKNDLLASETSCGFHEWYHTGALYSLLPHQLKTLRYILGSVDDMLEYYQGFQNMNLLPTEKGLKIKDSKNGWFNNNNINFKFRIKNRKYNIFWLIGVARSLNIINQIKNHDWLRRRAGEMKAIVNLNYYFSTLLNFILQNEKFYNIETSDIGINSRNLIDDLVATSLNNGLEISVSNEVLNIDKSDKIHVLDCKKNSYKVKNVALCNAQNISYFKDSKIKKSFAPIAIVEGLSDNAKSFVELDYYPKNCINQLIKGNGIGQVGGISFNNIKDCDAYLNKVLDKHKIYQPNLNELKRYNGIKAEITFKNQPRGYIYNISNIDDRIWSLVPGKFTLAFSMAPEFYRSIYKTNPKKNMVIINDNSKAKKYVARTIWEEALINK
mgnify:CR=1 FL=1